MLHDDNTPGAPPKQRRFAGDFCRNLRTGIRLAGLQRVTLTDFRASGSQLAAMTGVEFLLDFLLRLAVVGRHGYLETYELPATLFHVPLLLLAGVLIARLCRREELSLVLPLGLVTAAIPPAIVQSFLQLAIINHWLPPRPYLLDVDHYFPLFLWWLVAGCAALLRLCGGWRQRLGAVAAFLLVVGLPLWYIPRGSPWVGLPDDDGDDRQRPGVVSEETLYGQPRLLAETLERLQPGRPG
ncbi:MAG TPA: hypothetical protein VIU40_11280, partial [Geobacteraceae bacterium]